MFLSEISIFRRLRVSLGHFGQQAPESPVSQLQNGVSTSSLPPFIVDLGKPSCKIEILELRHRAFTDSLTKMTEGKPKSPKNHIF